MKFTPSRSRGGDRGYIRSHLIPRRVSAAIALACVAAVTLSACVTNTPSSGSAVSVPASTKLATGDVKLSLEYVDDPPTEDLVSAFERLHPNISIETQKVPFGDYLKSIKLAMSSDDAPDIAQYNPGAMHSLVPAGLIKDLDPYARAYGWDKAFPQTALATLKSNKTAKQYGTGSLYAVPGALSVLGVYYNKDLLAAAGVDAPPATLPEFEKDLQAVRDHGTTPFTVGAQTIGGFQVWNALTDVLGTPQQYRDWVYGKANASIETDGALKAAKTLVDWRRKGYIPASANATADSDALADFTNGKAAFYVSGSWSASGIEKALGDSAGFFAMPTEDASDTLAASGSAVSFSISAKSKHPNEAAAFLDFLHSEDAAAIQFKGGFLPVNTDVPLKASSGVRQDIVAAFAKINDGGGAAPFADFASSGMIDVLTSGSQGLLSDKTTPKQYLRSLQSEWESYHAE